MPRASAAPRPPRAAPEPRVGRRTAHAHVYLAPPRPLYECITPDDVTYTSDTGDGNPRWVPLWTLGYPVPLVRGPRSGFRMRSAPATSTISGGRTDRSTLAYGAGTVRAATPATSCRQPTSAPACAIAATKSAGASSTRCPANAMCCASRNAASTRAWTTDCGGNDARVALGCAHDAPRSASP